MSLNIKNERVHELAREAAILSGGTQTSALQQALEDYVAKLRREHQQADSADGGRIDDLLHGIRGRIRAEEPLSTDELWDPVLSREVDELLERLGVETVALDARQATIARAAFRDFGRGTGHPAQLTYGDCFSYALAAADGEPLLFVGDGFSRTDIRPAV